LKFIETKLPGSYIIELEKKFDERGYFARSWDGNIFKEHGLKSNIVQCNISFNKTRGTIRGLHYQESPFEETKLVRCTKGRVFEVMVDLRKNSSTYLQWFGIELDSNENNLLYVPENFALGFQTLEDNCELFYQMSQFYAPKHAKGIIWNDSSLKINWPINPPTIISKKDQSFEQIKI